jgi:hypothetical protein
LFRANLHRGGTEPEPSHLLQGTRDSLCTAKPQVLVFRARRTERRQENGAERNERRRKKGATLRACPASCSFLSPLFVLFGYHSSGCGRRPRWDLGVSVVRSLRLAGGQRPAFTGHVRSSESLTPGLVAATSAGGRDSIIRRLPPLVCYTKIHTEAEIFTARPAPSLEGERP